MMKPLTLSLVAALLGTAGPALAEQIPLVQDCRSEYVIYHDAAAPSSVVMAASELQDYLFKASGAVLAVVHEPRPPMISLGENAASRAAGLSVENVPCEGFRIVTKGGDIFILGRDFVQVITITNISDARDKSNITFI